MHDAAAPFPYKVMNHTQTFTTRYRARDNLILLFITTAPPKGIYRPPRLQDDPRHLKEHEVEVLLLHQRLVLAREVAARVAALRFGPRIRAPREVGELRLERLQRALRPLRFGLQRAGGVSDSSGRVGRGGD